MFFTVQLGYVGFSAWMSTTVDLEANELIIFDEVVSNIGGHFNPVQSVFICPFSGMYVFYTNVETTIDGQSAYAELMKNNFGLAKLDILQIITNVI